MSIKETLLAGSLPVVLGIIIGYLIAKLDKIIEKRSEIKNIKIIIWNELKENYLMIHEVAQEYYSNNEDINLRALILVMLKIDKNVYYKYLDKIYLLKHQAVKDIIKVYSRIDFDHDMYKLAVDRLRDKKLNPVDHSVLSNSVATTLDTMEKALQSLGTEKMDFRNINKSVKTDDEVEFSKWFKEKLTP